MSTTHTIHSDFYSVEFRADGLVDVYLIPSGRVYIYDDGRAEYDAEALVVRGIEPFENLESDIRERYADWCASAEKCI